MFSLACQYHRGKTAVFSRENCSFIGRKLQFLRGGTGLSKKRLTISNVLPRCIHRIPCPDLHHIAQGHALSCTALLEEEERYPSYI